MRFAPSLLFLVLVLAGCSSLQSRPQDGAPTLVSSDDLITYLGERGVILRPDGLAGPSVVHVVGQQFSIRGGGTVQVFEFVEADDAAMHVERYIIAARGGGPVALFQDGPLMAAYYGQSPSILAVLTDALGEATY